MKLDLDEKSVAAAVAERLTALMLEKHPGLLDELAQAERDRRDLLTPAEAAQMLGVTPRTLRANAAEWGIAVNVTLGFTNPRYSLSQIKSVLERGVIKPRLKTLRAA